LISSQKKKLFLSVAVIAAAAVILLALVPLLSLLFQEPPPTYDYDFADPSLSVDIFSDEDYMGLDRSIYYTTGQGGYEFKNAIGENDYTSYNKAVQLLIKLVLAAQAGDADAYNACFSAEYLQKEGRFGEFTMQKIYDINIKEYTPPSDIVLPDTYDEAYVYGLTYKIKDNNGSLRNDIGSDGAREQYITVVIDRNDRAWIYGVHTVHYRPVN
jgi:hypothetical protein